MSHADIDNTVVVSAPSGDVLLSELTENHNVAAAAGVVTLVSSASVDYTIDAVYPSLDSEGGLEAGSFLTIAAGTVDSGTRPVAYEAPIPPNDLRLAVTSTTDVTVIWRFK